jgi:hypothetical protein
MERRLYRAFGVFVLALCAFAHAQNRITYTGTLGEARIGLTLLVNDSGAIQGGHYFYAKYLKDIPLSGSFANGRVTLNESGGGVFTLAFKGNGSENGKPLDFNNSVGLQGAWTNAGKSLPVKLDSASADVVQGNSRWYEDVTQESDAAFEARVQGFRTAVLAGDHAAAARYVEFPLRVNSGGKSRTIRIAAQLSAQWGSIFTLQCVSALKNAVPHDMFVRNGQAMLGDGVAWFGPKGAQAINIP